MSNPDRRAVMISSVKLAGALILTLTATGFGWSRSGIQDQKEGTGAISGRITVEGKPAPGVVVIATPADLSTEARFLGPSVALRATADYEGHYRIAGLPAARYKVEPFAPALVNTSANGPA